MGAVSNLVNAVGVAVACQRDKFVAILKNEPIVTSTHDYNDQTISNFTISAYINGSHKTVGRFALRQLPGCCGVVVFHHSEVTSEFRKKGLGKLFLQIRHHAAVLAGYSLAMATVQVTNTVECKMLEKEGWQAVAEFVNKRTNNKIRVYTFNLQP